MSETRPSSHERDPEPAPSRPRRIAIIGGTMAGLTAAHELSRTPKLRRRFQVVVYESSWRVGGALAGGRAIDPKRGFPSQDLALPLLFGCNDNSLNLVRDVYHAHGRDWRSMFRSHRRLGLAWSETAPQRSRSREITWPMNADEPGGSKPHVERWELMVELMRTIGDLVRPWALEPPRELGSISLLESMLVPPSVERALAAASVPAPPPWLRKSGSSGLVWRSAALLRRRTSGVASMLPNAVEARAREVVEGGIRSALDWLLESASRWMSKFEEGPSSRDWDTLEGLRWLLGALVSSLAKREMPLEGEGGPRLESLLVATTVLRGLLNPRYGLVDDFDLDRLDHLDFRQWLLENAVPAAQASIQEGSVVRALYAVCHAYEDGNLDRPSFAAGAGCRTALRLMTTYKEAPIFASRAPLSESIVAPLYALLRERGVEFRFFHDFEGLELEDDQVHGVRLVEHAQTWGDYEPTFELGRGMIAWPSAPFEDQIRGHERKPVVLTHGTDFDEVVIALPVGDIRNARADWTRCSPALERFLAATRPVPVYRGRVEVPADATPPTRPTIGGPSGLAFSMPFAQGQGVVIEGTGRPEIDEGGTGMIEVLESASCQVGCMHLRPDGAHLLANLHGAGDWTRNGFDLPGTESCVMAGMIAARAIHAEDRPVVGEFFFR